MMLSDYERKLRNQPNNRFLLVMSIMDVLVSFSFMASSLPIPKETGQYAAIGNDITCSIQGFLFQIGISVPCYNASLCIWFLMNIKYNMQPREFAAKVEPYCHVLSLGLPLARAIACFALDLFAPRGMYCIGKRSSLVLVMILSTVLLALNFIIIIYCMGAIYISFVEKEKRMRRYSTSESGMMWRPNASLQGKKLAAKQGLLYSLAYFITFIFPLLNTFIPQKYTYNVFFYLQSIFLPLQGFWNFLLYTRHSVSRIQDQYPELALYKIFWMIVFHPDKVKPKRIRRQSVTRNSIMQGNHINHVAKQKKREESKKDVVAARGDIIFQADGETKQEERKPDRPVKKIKMNTTHDGIEEALLQLKEEGVDIDSDTDERCAKQERRKPDHLVEHIRTNTTPCKDIEEVAVTLNDEGLVIGSDNNECNV